MACSPSGDYFYFLDFAFICRLYLLSRQSANRRARDKRYRSNSIDMNSKEHVARQKFIEILSGSFPSHRFMKSPKPKPLVAMDLLLIKDVGQAAIGNISNFLLLGKFSVRKKLSTVAEKLLAHESFD